MQEKSLERRINALKDGLLESQNAKEILQTFYTRWFESFDMEIVIQDISPEQDSDVIQKIQEKNPAAMDPFVVLFNFKTSDKPNIDLAIKSLFAPAVELHPEAVCAYFESVLGAKKAEFPFLNNEERKLVLSEVDNEGSIDRKLIGFIELLKGKKINPNLLSQIDQDRLKNLLKIECSKPLERMDYKIILACIDACTDFRGVKIRNDPLLHWAAKNGHTEVVKAILESPKCTEKLVNQEDRYHNTALYWAAINGRAEVLEVLIEKGADFDVEVGELSLLDYAAEKGYTGVVKAILKSPNGAAMLNKKDLYSDDTALHLAACHGRTEVVKVILESPCCTKELLNRKNYEGKTALRLAIYNDELFQVRRNSKYIGVIKASLEKGAEVSFDEVWNARSDLKSLYARVYIKQNQIKSTVFFGVLACIALSGVFGVPVISNLKDVARDACAKLFEAAGKGVGK